MSKREQIQEYCRFLFQQEVQIIVFFTLAEYNGSRNGLLYDHQRGVFYSPKYTAIVLYKSFTFESMTQYGIDQNILFRAYDEGDSNSKATRETVLDKLLMAVEKRMGSVMKVGPSGTVDIEKTKLVGYGTPGVAFATVMKSTFAGVVG